MGSFFGGGGSDAADASRDAAQIAADYDREALDYLKEREALPQQYREEAITRMGSAIGLDGPESQAASLESLKSSPLYQAIVGNREQGEESILRNRAATGGLRSGGTQEALYDYNTQLENSALLESYNQLQGLAGLPSLAPAIAQQTSGIGQTLAQGEVAAAQAQQSGGQMGINNLFGAGQLGLQAYDVFSDIRLKENVDYLGNFYGHSWYAWDWNNEAKSLGLEGKSIGVMVHEVMETNPEIIGSKDGYATIDMGKIADIEDLMKRAA